jgi:hypothetical protein
MTPPITICAVTAAGLNHATIVSGAAVTVVHALPEKSGVALLNEKAKD